MEQAKQVKVTVEIESAGGNMKAEEVLDVSKLGLVGGFQGEKEALKSYTKPELMSFAQDAMDKLKKKVLAGLLALLCIFSFALPSYADTVHSDVWCWQTAKKAKVCIKTAETSLNCSSAAGTCTATNLIPAGSIVLGVATRVTTLFVGCTSIDIGDGTDADKWGDDEAITAGSTTTAVHSTAGDPTTYAAATSVVLTANGGAADFSAGIITISVLYMDLTAPQE